MSRTGHPLLRASVPQILTGCRIVLGAAALIAVSRGDVYLAATVITLGAVTDGLDGAAARWLGGGSTFGIWFDYLSDYLCYIVAPWSLARAIFPGTGALYETAVGLPLVTGAIRYARNGALLSTSAPAVPELPGLGTVFAAFVPVTAIFLDVALQPAGWRSALFIGMYLVFSVLMVSPIRFPKLSTLRGASPLVLVLLAVEPFWATRIIAGATLAIGSAYVVIGGLLAGRVRERIGADASHARRDLARR